MVFCDKEYDAVARYQSEAMHENRLEYVLFLTHPLPDMPTSRSEFAEEMVTELLDKDLSTHSQYDLGAVVGALKAAIKARDAYVTRVLWTKIDSEVSEKPPLNMSDVEITPELLRFLLCYAQMPSLVLVLDNQHKTPFLTSPPMIQNVLDASDANRDWTHGHEIVALVAAVMHALTAVREQRKGKRAHREVDPVWDHVLTRLIAAMPRNPGLLIRRTVPDDLPSWKSIERVIDVAVRCTKTSCSDLKHLLKQCEFAFDHLAEAFQLALMCGAAKDHVLVSALSAIYQKILDQNPWEGRHARASNNVRFHGCMNKVWIAVASHSTKNVLVPLCGPDKTQLALVPVPDKGAGRDPSVFVDIVGALDSAHSPFSQHSDDVAYLACKALNVAMRCNGKVLLVQALVDLVIGHKDVGFLIANVPKFVCRAVISFQTVFDSLEPVAFALAMQTSEENPLGDALLEAIEEGHRDAVRTLLELLLGIPEPKKEFLLTYVRTMCGIKWPCPGSDVDHAFSSDLKAAHCAEVKSDFQDFLRRGSPWTDEELQAALRVASHERASIAVQVLVSPPYEASVPENDSFVGHILQHVLAPEGTIANDAKARFEEAAL
tara:strand:- start:2119 stop:3927 length:1809 start_codon:yes stop_codon:yes gene_type:complete